MGDAGDDRDTRPRALGRGPVARLVRLVWAAPASVLGLLLSPFFARRRIAEGVLLCEGASWPRKLGWKYSAITFGHVVLCVEPIAPKTFEHELVHVSQYERWGVFLWPAYVTASLWAKVRGLRPYWDNHFERQARGES